MNVVIAFGSNLGDKEKNIHSALDLMKEKCSVKKVSSLIETEPWGYLEQDTFLNGAVIVETELSPEDLLVFLKSIENKLGRVKVIKNGPRTIDLDIIFYGDLVMETDELIIPHPRMHERTFVLEPLMQICPDHVHPKLKKTVKELLRQL